MYDLKENYSCQVPEAPSRADLELIAIPITFVLRFRKQLQLYDSYKNALLWVCIPTFRIYCNTMWRLF